MRRELGETLRRVENRIMKRVRDPSSADVLGQDPISFDARKLVGHRHVLLVTARRTDTEIATPVWFALDGNRLVLRSGAADPKVTRIRRDSNVKVAACTPRGRPLGAPMRARARILQPAEEPQAERTLRRALGWQRRLYNHTRAPFLWMTYVEVTPAGPEAIDAIDDEIGPAAARIT